MIERQVYTSVIERNGNGSGNRNGFHKRLELAPLFSEEEQEDKKLLDIVLERTGKNLNSLPHNVVKTIAIVDNLTYPPDPEKPTEIKPLSISDKFRIAGYAFWEVEGKFSLVKEYLGEVEGPKWEAILDHVWERNDLVEIYNKFDEERKLLESFAPKIRKPENILIILKLLKEKKATGVSNEELLEKRDAFIESLQNEFRGRKPRKNPSEMLEEQRLALGTKDLLDNKNIHDIFRKYEIDRAALRRIRRELFEKGKITLNLKDVELKIKELRDGKLSNSKIARVTGISHKRISRISEKLLLMGLIDTLYNKGARRVFETRRLYDELVDAYRDGKEIDPYRLSVLRAIGEIEPEKRKYSEEAKEKFKQARQAKFKDPEFRKVHQAIHGHPRSPKERKNISKGKKEKMTQKIKDKIGRTRREKGLGGRKMSSEEARNVALKRWGKSS